MLNLDFAMSLKNFDVLVANYMWAFARVSGFLVVVPPFNEFLAVKQKLILAFCIIGCMLINQHFTLISIEPFSTKSIFISIGEFFIGILIGFIPALYISLFAMAGNIVSVQMGLSMAQITDPISGTIIPIISQFYSLCVLLLFVSVNGHLVLISSLINSFKLLPIGTYDNLFELLSFVYHHYAVIWKNVLVISLPSIFLLLLGSIMLGFVTRVAPQLNFMSIGFSASLLFGMCVLLATMHGFYDASLRFIEEMLLETKKLITN